MTTTSTARPTRRTVGVASLVLFLLLTAVWLLDRVAPTTTEDHTGTLDPAPRLTIDLGAGDMSLLPSPDGRIQIWRTVTTGWREPTIEERSDGHGAVISAHCPTVLAAGCHIVYRIAVPDGIALDVSANSGEIRMRDLLLDSAQIQASSGRIELTDITANTLDVRAGSGWITATGLNTPTTTADVSSGSMSLAFATPPDTVRASASSGNLTLLLPTTDVTYRVDADVSSGSRRVEVPTDPVSLHAVTATTSSGDLSVLPT